MTRKRYKKLLMSVGMERNQAELFSRLACYLRRPYADAWSDLCDALDGNGGAA